MSLLFFFFFNDTATTEIYTLSLHDALPIYDLIGSFGDVSHEDPVFADEKRDRCGEYSVFPGQFPAFRSEEHTSELQSHHDLVCRLLLEKKKKQIKQIISKTEKKIYKYYDTT